MGVVFLVVLGIAIHIVLLLSVFDIYFSSPILHDILTAPNNIPTPCERVVFISVDGLRFDALTDEDATSGSRVAPFLRRKMDEWNAWGVSKCHLPTESRPGHVAMLAGFYEDPSAVTKGWKENPVDFDSVFNRSKCSFSWGSPDIINIFYKGLNHNCSYKWTYSESQDFSGNTMGYDNWVYNQVLKFLKNETNFHLYSKRNSFFFLHLLGQDTSGHTHKPWTPLYKENLKNVDRLIRLFDKLFGEIFPSNKTSFIVSADHGMTDWGSHGSGDPSETMTPILAWGCGIKKRPPTEPKLEINQSDITPLISILLGSSIPVNSIGVLPHAILNFSRLHLADAYFLNAEQMIQHYRAKRMEVEAKVPISLLKVFSGLDEGHISSLKNSVTKHIQQGRVDDANQVSRILIDLSLEGIQYYQNYFQPFLLGCTSAIFLGWMFILIIKINDFPLEKAIYSRKLAGLIALMGLIGFIIYRQAFPLTYYAYILIPFILWWFLLLDIASLRLIITSLTLKGVFTTIFIIFCLEILVIGFFHRWVLSISLANIVLWPFYEISLKRHHWKVVLLWVCSGTMLATFSLIPVVGKQVNPQILGSATFLIFGGIVAGSWNKSVSNLQKVFAFLRLTFLLMAGLINFTIQSSFLENNEVNQDYHKISWGLLLSSVFLLLEPPSGVLQKLLSVYNVLAIPFLLLCVSHEGFFLLSLFVHMFCWNALEMINANVVGLSVDYQQYTRRKLHDDVTYSDFRKAYFFLTYIYVAFFGVGNLASLNSFDPAWVRCFLTTFSPFTMTALILLKVVIPFFVVCLAVRALTVMLNIRPYKLFLILLLYCNLMGLNFLYLVRNEGSWLDIGSSLSHYIIQQLIIVFLLFLYLLAQLVVPSNSSSSAKFHLL